VQATIEMEKTMILLPATRALISSVSALRKLERPGFIANYSRMPIFGCLR
jgi:hypothetical protein